MAKKPKLEILTSTQSFSPIADIKDGIIITKDSRFIKLLEIKPINFALRSAIEQAEVLGNYASALRSFPERFHIKITSRKSDISPFVAQIEQEMEAEPSPEVRKQQQETIDLVQRVGTSMAVTRKFYMDFEYTTDSQIYKTPSFEQVKIKLDREAKGIKAVLAACGNDVAMPEDDSYVLATLYQLMSRAESDKNLWADRLSDVISNYAKAAIDLAGEATLPINDFICPARIDPAPSPSYMCIDGLYYMFCYIPSKAYPIETYGGWLMPFLNFAEGVDVDIWYQKEAVEKVSNKLDYGMRLNLAQMSGAQDTDKDYDSMLKSMESAYLIKQALANGDEMGYFSIMFTITAYDLDILEYKYKELKKLCARNDLKLKQCLFQSLDAFKSTLPICRYDENIFKKSKRNILLSQFASTYPFTSFELSDKNGVMLGINGNNNSLVFLDVYDTSKYNNANMLILGSPGGGKTYLAQLLALRMRARGIQIFSVVALKGYEYERACNAVGGQFIRVDPDSAQTINVMEIRKRAGESSILNVGSAASQSSILIAKVQQLHRFFQLLLPDITVDEKQHLDEALVDTYKDFGITADNSTLDDPTNPGKYKPMPILGDLYAHLEGMGTQVSRLVAALKRFVIGSASSFNQQTNIDVNNKYTVFDVSNMSEEMRPIGLFIATEFVWDKIKENPSVKKALFMEECWRLGPIVIEIFKIIRGYGGSAVAVTQEITDTFSAGNRELSSTLVATSEIKVIMKTKPKEAEIIGRELDLSEQEVDEITQFKERGQCLLAASANHVYMQVQSTPSEHDLITTDRKDYERLEREYKLKGGADK